MDGGGSGDEVKLEWRGGEGGGGEKGKLEEGGGVGGSVRWRRSGIEMRASKWRDV